MTTSIRIHGSYTYADAATLTQALAAAEERYTQQRARTKGALFTPLHWNRNGLVVKIFFEDSGPEAQVSDAEHVVEVLASHAADGQVTFARPGAARIIYAPQAEIFAHLLDLIKRHDHEAIEGARDQIKPALLPKLAAVYQTLGSWDEKAALVTLVQDHISPITRALMYDILDAPVSTKSYDESVELAHLIALCHIAGRFDLFQRYFDDRKALALEVARLRSQH